MAMPIKVMCHLLDDQPVVLTLLERTMQLEGFTEYRLFSSVEEFEAEMNESVNIAVIDFLLSNTNVTGLDITKKVMQVNPRCYVIMISAQNDPDVIIDFFEFGGWKYIKKMGNYYEKVAAYIKKAVHQIHSDMEWYAELLLKQQKATQIQNDFTGNPDRLSGK